MLTFIRPSEASFAIDLGTRNILISDRQKICYQQQTVAAFPVNSSPDKRKCIVGIGAEEIYEKDPSQYQIVKPVRKGVICDLDYCREVVSYALRLVTRRSFRKPGLLVSVPLDVTEVEKAAFKEVLLGLSYPLVEMVTEPTAAALGFVPNFMSKNGVLLVDIGAGISECVVFSRGGVVCNNSLRVGGEDFEAALKSLLRKRYNFDIGHRATLYLLDLVSQQYADAYLHPIELKGLDLSTSLPSVLKLELNDLDDSLDSLYMQIVDKILQVLEKTPEELSSDILENGVYLTGGASQSKRLIALIEQHTNLKVVPDAQALLGVARGEVALLQNSKLKKQLLCA